MVTHAISFTIIKFYCPNQGRNTERFSWGLNPIYSWLYFVREIALTRHRSLLGNKIAQFQELSEQPKESSEYPWQLPPLGVWDLFLLALMWREFSLCLHVWVSDRLPRWLSGKESACNAGDTGLIPRWGRSPGEGHGKPLQYSCLGNPMERAWRATVHGVTKSRTRLNNNNWVSEAQTQSLWHGRHFEPQWGTMPSLTEGREKTHSPQSHSLGTTGKQS